MLEELRLKGTFGHANRTIRFEQGMTAITGPNESGKSMIIEMVRFCLFGTKALRGQAADYKTLEAALDFKVKGVPYTVSRKGSHVLLHERGIPVATGTQPVNQKIINILGYDMKVFDVSNACLQSKVEALGDMLPTERKKMVDQTIGLDVLDQLSTRISADANDATKAAVAIEGVLREPAEPVGPAGYQHSSTIRPLHAAAVERVAAANRLRGIATSAIPAAPSRPREPTTETLEELTAHQQNRAIIVARVAAAVAKLATLKKPSYTEEQLDELVSQHAAADLWAKRKAVKQSRYTIADLDGMVAQWAAADAWEMRQRLAAHGEHTCPNCSHHWFEMDLGDVADAVQTARPQLTQGQILAERQVIAGQDEYIEAVETARPGLTLNQITEQRNMIARYGDRLVLEQEAAEPVPADKAALLNSRRLYDLAMAGYDQQVAAHEAALAARQQAITDLEAYEGAEASRDELQATLTAALQYEQAIDQFAADRQVYDEGVAKLEAHRKVAADMGAAKEALKALRISVKAHIAPSLSRVASGLIEKMTGGKREFIHVDEEFNITVDGQQLNTLSGSGKAVANVALRIGLGQVLTNKVFSVFLADEIDQGMDDERAEYTAQCLRNLTTNINQIVLVSHKKPDADHIIQLG